MSVGPGLLVRGRILLELDAGDPKRLRIGRNVTLMPGTHLKLRENGAIHLHDGVKLDTTTRLVAARDGTIEIGERTGVGMGSIINAGADVRIGRGSLIASHCVFAASFHGIAAGTPIRSQPHEHAPISIGEDVWLGAGAFVGKGLRIGDGAVVAAGAAVTGDISPGAVVAGVPARAIGQRS